MIVEILSLRDVKSEAYGNPVFPAKVGMVIRELTDLINDPKSDQLVSKYPGDFQLFRFGTFDTVSGEFNLLPRPVLVVECSGLKLPSAREVPLPVTPDKY